MNAGGGAAGAVPAVLPSRQPGGADVRAEAQQRTAVDRCCSGRCCGAATRQAEERPQSAAVAVGSDPGDPVRGAEVEHDHGSAAGGPRRRQARPPHPVNTGLSLIRSTPGTTRRPTKRPTAFFGRA